MDGDQIAQFGYLVLLLVAVGGSFLVSQRQNLGKSLQQAAIWGLIFVGTVAVVGLWGDVKNTVSPRQASLSTGEITVPRMPDGHFYLDLTINGQDTRFVVDTGASEMVLTTADAARVGIDVAQLDFLGRANTANGQVRIARVTLDQVQLEDIVDRGFRATVNQGEMRQSLLGMTYLSRFERISIEGDRLILER
ncbi:retropepsin-like aspartic protease family protein [Algirhabdus cladophorae]|uniref:retropepsin-like aspartic protease family protein n=1 Tax=Algirhabdus cladophorae TaxID=3377108 RepID=UPI003B84B2B4